MDTVDVVVSGTVATVSLNRPDVRNAIDAQMISELSDTFRDIATRDDIRVVILRGNGPSFCAGADISWMRASLDFSREENVADAARLSDMFALIATIPQPVVARVHGACLGGGMGMIAVSDIVVASDDAVFGFTETRLGIVPAVISRFVLPKIGESWARALFPTGEQFGIEVARQIGLVHWSASALELDNIITAKLLGLLGNGPTAVRAAKALIFELRGLSPDQARDLTTHRIAALRAGPEGQEGLRAFLEKRRPAWRPLE